MNTMPTAATTSSPDYNASRHTFTPFVRVEFTNSTAVKLLPEFHLYTAMNVPFAVLGESGEDLGFVCNLKPGSLARKRYFTCQKRAVALNNLARENAAERGESDPNTVSTMYVSEGVCCNSRIVAGLLAFAFPNRAEPPAFKEIDSAYDRGDTIKLPSAEEAQKILERGIEGVEFDDYAELRHVLSLPVQVLSGYGHDWLVRNFAFPADWQPLG